MARIQKGYNVIVQSSLAPTQMASIPCSTADTSLKARWPKVLSEGAASAAAYTCLFEEHTKPSPIWYLAYGSNLNSKIFKEKRGAKPLDERLVLVEGLELTFDLPGLPYVEPRFANCRLFSPVFSNDEVAIGEAMGFVGCASHIDLNGPWTGKGALIGVAYLLTFEDFARVVKAEGGGSGYRMVSVQGKVFRRKAGTEKEEMIFEVTRETVDAFSLLAPEECTRKLPGQPSLRYLTLIREGAKEHDLPLGYRAYLASVTPYSPTTFRQKLGAAITVALCSIPSIVLLLLGIAFAHEDGSYPGWFSKARGKFVRAIWPLYDNCMSWLFGEGERTIHGDD